MILISIYFHRFLIILFAPFLGILLAHALILVRQERVLFDMSSIQLQYLILLLRLDGNLEGNVLRLGIRQWPFKVLVGYSSFLIQLQNIILRLRLIISALLVNHSCQIGGLQGVLVALCVELLAI